MAQALTILILTAFVSLAQATSPEKSRCDSFQAALTSIEKTRPKTPLRLAFTAPPSAAEKFDSSWWFLEVEDFTIPVPELPKTLERAPDGLITIGSKNFTVVMGPDTMTAEFEKYKGTFGSFKIQSDFDYNLFLWSPNFATCADLENDRALAAKTNLAAAKSLTPPFSLAKAWHFSDARLIALTGPRAAQTSATTNLLVKKGDGKSFNAIVKFASDAEQAKFHSYLPRLRDKQFFAAGKRLKL